jgi:quinol monooxygenase YgiN
MIIVTGSVLVRDGAAEDAIALSLEHVRRSRLEPGCLSHAVHQDTENPQRLFFFEEWRDRDALSAHFALPASRAFAKSLGALGAEPPTLKIFEATQTGP